MRPKFIGRGQIESAIVVLVCLAGCALMLFVVAAIQMARG